MQKILIVEDAQINRELLREAQLRRVEEKLFQAVEEARKGAFPLEELHEMLDILYKGEEL